MNTHFPFEWLVIRHVNFGAWGISLIYVSGQTFSSALICIQHSTRKTTEFKVVMLELDCKGKGPSGQSNMETQAQVWQHTVFWGSLVRAVARTRRERLQKTHAERGRQSQGVKGPAHQLHNGHIKKLQGKPTGSAVRRAPFETRHFPAQWPWAVI